MSGSEYFERPNCPAQTRFQGGRLAHSPARLEKLEPARTFAWLDYKTTNIARVHEFLISFYTDKNDQDRSQTKMSGGGACALK